MAPPASISVSNFNSISASISNADPDFTEFVRTRSEDAFRRLVRRHMGMVRSAARRLLGNRGDAAAADVAQTVFCQLARRAAALPPDLVVSLWLHTQTRRAALNHLRGENRRTVRERAAADLMRMNAPDPPDPAGVSAALTPHIDAAIGELPALERRALALRFFDQLELQEIGARLGLSAGAVRKRLERALEKLRHRLSRRGVALSAAALTIWLTHESVQAAPAALTASAVAAAMAAPVAQSAGGPLSFLTVMTGIKSLLTGAALGLAGGGFWAIHAPPPPDPAAALALPPALAPASLPGGGNGAAAVQRYTVPAPAGNAGALMEQLNSIIAAPDTEVTRQRLAAWLAEVPPDLWEPLVDLADRQLSPTERGRWLPELARQWAGTDPEKAILSLAAKRDFGNTSGSDLAAAGFRVWHKASPDKAQKWLVDRQDNPALAESLPKFISVVAETLAGISNNAVLDWSSRLQGNDLRDAALEALLNKLTNDREPAWQDVCGRLVREEKADFSRQALRGVLQRWSLFESGGVENFDQWLAGLPESPGKKMAAELILTDAIRRKSSKPPAHALAALASEGAEIAGRTAARMIMEDHRPARRAREWLLPLIPGPERDAVAFQAARKAAAGPENRGDGNIQEATAWAAELSDPGVRDPLVYGLFQNLLQQHQQKNGSAGEAIKWAESDGLPPEIQNQLRRAARDFQARTQP